MSDISFFFLVSLPAFICAYRSYEYLQYTSFGRMIGNFLNIFVDYQSKIWIDGVVMVMTGVTLMLLMLAALLWFWAIPFLFIFHLLLD